MEVRSVAGVEPRGFFAPQGGRVPTKGAAAPAPTEAAKLEASKTDEADAQRAKKVATIRLTEVTGTRMRVDNDSNRIITQLVNESNEVVKQIPQEALLRIAANMRRLQSLLFDQTV